MSSGSHRRVAPASPAFGAQQGARDPLPLNRNIPLEIPQFSAVVRAWALMALSLQ
jgi:hypothetical protein